MENSEIIRYQNSIFTIIAIVKTPLIGKVKKL